MIPEALLIKDKISKAVKCKLLDVSKLNEMTPKELQLF
jgi:hypothetical protein